MPCPPQRVKKASQSLPPVAANRVKTVFCRGVYLAESIGNRCAANHDLHGVTDTGSLGSLYHVSHHAHGGGQQSGAADDLAALFLSGLDEGFGGDVGAQVNHFQTLAFHHHLHQVLADVVQVALDGADADLAGGLYAVLSQQGLEQVGTHIHGTGSHQNFGNENFIVLELLADDAHTGQQTLFQNLLGGNAFVNGLLYQSLDDLCLTGLAIQLIDSKGSMIMSFGQSTSYCAILKKKVFDKSECFRLHMKAGKTAQVLGEAYIFACQANLNHIAFPLINSGELLGSVIIGPFLMDQPDSTLVSDLAERYHLPATLSLELYDELKTLVILSPTKVNQLKTLIDHVLSPLLPGERALLLENQQKMSQQARLNETIQVFKEQKFDRSLAAFYKKEQDLLSRGRSGTVTEVKALLNDLIDYVLFSEGGQLESVRVRSIELTTLLSRVAIDGGAQTDNVFYLSSQFILKLYQQQTLEDICLLMQEVLESFMNAMFNETDKGNPYIRKALRFMQDNYSEHLELAQVAEYVGLSPSYFSALFNQIVGVSFREQLCRIRVEESKRLLLQKDYSLVDIALAMGFPDQSYYSKVFKRIVGVTPGKYRS